MPRPPRSLLALALLVSTPSRYAAAAETDAYYAWRRSVADSTAALNAEVNATFEEVLFRLGRAQGLGCEEVARAITEPFFSTGLWFFVGAMRGFGFAHVPMSNTEYEERYAPIGVYRHAPPWQLGLWVPLDPTVRLGGVNVGTDKLGHFFPNGRRYYDRFLEARAAGRTEREAIEAAVHVGVEQELGILGGAVSGIFSFADLEANYQGLRFFRSLCEGEAPLLIRVEDRWRLREPFDITRYVNPCWDEAYYNNAYLGSLWPSVRRGLLGYCSVRERPHVRRLLERYRRTGCHSASVALLDELTAKGVVPDRAPHSLEAACGPPTPAGP